MFLATPKLCGHAPQVFGEDVTAPAVLRELILFHQAVLGTGVDHILSVVQIRKHFPLPTKMDYLGGFHLTQVGDDDLQSRGSGFITKAGK